MPAALTPANQLTLLRMLLIPVFAICVIYDYLGTALVVFSTAGLTDLLDGLIARRTGQKTTLGAWLDPMADKLLLVTTFVVLTLPLEHLTNRLPLWLTVLMISRDVGIVATVAIVNLAVGHRTFVPSLLGKIATATFIVTGVVTLYANFLGRPMFVVELAIWASLAITLLSGLHYIVHAARLVAHS
jgi:cardiolipin synthase